MKLAQQQLHVGIGEIVISEDLTSIIVAANLGSCLGFSVYDNKRKLAGMVHCLLPLSKSDPDKAKAKPGMYVDTGVCALMSHFLDSGSNREDLVLGVAGGAAVSDSGGVFDIGKKNYVALKKMLWKNSLLLKAEHVGENYPRTVMLHVNDGTLLLKAQGETIQLF